MKTVKRHSMVSAWVMAAMLIALPALAQNQASQKQRSDGEAPIVIGPGSKAYK
jgi:hypothetical protein